VRRLAAVLFDMDGTLIDTEKFWDVSLDELAERLGGRLSAQGRAGIVGRPIRDSIPMLHADLGIVDGDADRDGRWLVARTGELFAAGVPWRPGAEDLLRAVRAAGLPTALVTSTHRMLTDEALRTIGAEHFDVVVCGDEVTRTKPDPEPYTRAAAALGVDPGRCVAIEDSITGTVSAVAAGCVALVVPAEVPVPPGPRWVIRESLVGVTVDDLDRLLDDHG